MQIKTKKHNADGNVRLETSGQLKEIVINEDFLSPEKASVALCFKGKNSSGIVHLSLNEVKFLAREIEPKLSMMEKVKVLKFEKEKTKKRK
ncbi:MAG: hypothetical protein AABX85_02320 [Nanoarchaeota archaeon]